MRSIGIALSEDGLFEIIYYKSGREMFIEKNTSSIKQDDLNEWLTKGNAPVTAESANELELEDEN